LFNHSALLKEEKTLKISIFGLGYVGCVSLGCLSRNGHQVTGVDLNSKKVNFINQGKATIVENEIEAIIFEQHKFGNITATTDGIDAVRNTDVSIICVGTPSTTNGHLDISAILNVSEEIGKGIGGKDSFHIVIIRSTVFPGTNKKVTKILEKASGKEVDKDFTVVSNPEFLREGTAVKDYYNPSFTLVGTSNNQVIDTVKKIYDGIEAPFIATDIKIAEMIKYINNAFHALKITFGNEVGNICKKLEIDSHKLMEIFCADKKLNLSSYYLKPGFSYGGSCLPKDLKALCTIAHDFYLKCPVIENIDISNEIQKENVLNQIISFGKKKIGFLGVSFKSGTDDLRNSPIIDVLERLLGKGFEVKIYDRNVHLSQLTGANKEYILQRIPFISRFIHKDIMQVIDHSEVIVVVNKEKQFKEVLEKKCSNKIIYDLVRLDIDRGKTASDYMGIAW
jgi:GDP-mannose 6-dehydrogenase